MHKPATKLTGLVLAGLICACASTPRDAAPRKAAVDPWSVPDVTPIAEPRSRYGNPASYEVFGKTYHVLDSADGYRERGHASWYGTKFHGRRTSSGEPYDMYALTAAHKTLPLPSWVRVTNLDNGRQLVVRVNDRGPFHPGRIIDLSYTAAVRLGVYATGTAPVEVEALQPGQPDAPPPPATSPAPDALDSLIASLPDTPQAPAEERPVFLQLGAFRTMANCARLIRELEQTGMQGVSQRSAASGNACQVVQGPFANRPDALLQAQKLRELGYAPFLID